MTKQDQCMTITGSAHDTFTFGNLVEALAQPRAGDIQIVVHLQSQPELRGTASERPDHAREYMAHSAIRQASEDRTGFALVRPHQRRQAGASAGSGPLTRPAASRYWFSSSDRPVSPAR